MLTLFKRKTPIEKAEAECRKVWKANPNAKWAWHLHHEQLAERIDYYSSSPVDRINFIRDNKVESERVTRFNLFRPIKDDSLLLQYGGTISAYPFSLDRVFPRISEQLAILHKQECNPCPWDGKTIFPIKATPTLSRQNKP